MILILILLILLMVEEILHRLNSGSSFKNVDLAGDSVEEVENKRTGRITGILVWLRIVELLVFGLLFAVIAARSGVKVIYTSAGQLAGLVLLIQAVRILNRKVINQWAVLGVTVILQVFLLAMLLVTGTMPEDSIQPLAHEAAWIVSLMSFVVFFLLSVTIPFIGTFYLRLLSREGTGFYYLLPSLAYSEYWIKRLTKISSNTAFAVLLLILFLFIRFEYPAGTSILQAVQVAFLLIGRFFFRNRLKLFHPAAVLLVFAAWIANVIWLMANLSSVCSGWIA